MRTFWLISCWVLALASNLTLAEPPNSFQSVDNDKDLSAARAGIGADKAKAVTAAVRLVRTKKHEEADKILDEVIDYFEDTIANGDKTKKHLSFSSREDWEDYQKQTHQEVVWLNESYGRALHTRAVLEVNRKEMGTAIETLLQAIQVAPYDASALIELGYLSSMLKDFKKARGFYERALILCETKKANAPYKGMALRGLGFSMIELGDLPKAEWLYKRSLEVEPDNKSAVKELEYIQKLRSGGQSTEAAADPSPIRAD